MMEAGKALGWKMHLYDGKGSPANYTKGINDAIAAGANGILPVSYDCPIVKQALESAKKAGVKSVPILGWDCGELAAGQQDLYTAHLGFGTRYPNQEAEYRASGSDMAAWVVAQTRGKGNVLEFANEEFYTLKFQQLAFDTRLKQLCPNCKLTHVPYQVIDFGPKLQAKAKAALVQNPDANTMVGVPIPAAGPSAAVVQAGRVKTMKVIGGYGLSGDTDLVRANQGLNGIFAQPMGWIAYASVDILNRAFNGKPQVDEGVGYGILDATHNLPPAHQGFETNVPYKSLYDKSWGVSG
jgi:ribose transport system substrate-binding protein